MTNFEFVVTDGAAKKVTAAARSHAVKSGLHRKTRAQSPGSQSSQLTIRQKSTLTGRFRLGVKAGPRSKEGKKGAAAGPVPGSVTLPDDSLERADNTSTATSRDATQSNRERLLRKVLRKSQALVIAPSQARGDPFNALTVSQSDGVDRLIRFFISRFDLQISIAQIQKQWWGFAVYDPTVLHATLSLAATTWAMLIPEPDAASREGMRQKAYALESVQKRLGENDMSDAVVGAVAALASVEAAEGDFQAGVAHVKGIQLLCKARGGYTVFENNVHVARAMNWADLQVAVGLGSRPLLPLLHPLESLSLPPRVLALAAEPSLSHLRIFEGSPEVSTVRYSFSVLRQAYHGLTTADLSVHELRVLINGADFHLAHAVADDRLTPPGRAVLLAGQLFMYHIVRETHIECLIPVILVRRLSKHLGPILDDMAAAPDMWSGLVWCLGLGAAATPDSGEMWDFYSAHLWKVMRMMGLKTALGFEAVVRRFVWDDSLSQRLLAYGRLRPSLFDQQSLS